MTGILIRRLAGLSLCGTLILVAPASAEDRTPEEIIAAIEAVELPRFDPERRGDDESMQEYFRRMREASGRRAELIGELFRVAPEHPKLPGLMPDRWIALMDRPETRQQANDEMAALAADESSPLRADASYFQAFSTMRMGRGDERAILDAIESFIAIAPEDDRGAQLLRQAAEYALPGLADDRKEAMLRRVLDEYPDSSTAAQVRGGLRQSEAVGKPFALTFNDATTGRTISVQDDLKGKVVVVDFWATWCGPCVAEMPKMKQLYAEYKDKGVEFIGVSLDQPEDQGGLDALKRYVRENDIDWPQYYQGDGWQSEFSRSWGINAIPALFVIDSQGNLHSNKARGQLERMIPELLEKGASAGEE